MKPLTIVRRCFPEIEYDDHYLFLWEIENMPEHCAVVNNDGRILWGLHIEDFIEVPIEET